MSSTLQVVPTPDGVNRARDSAFQDRDHALAAGGADRDQAAAGGALGRSCCASSLASTLTIRPPVAANGWPAASEEPFTLSLARSIAERGVEAEALLAEHRVLPGLERGEHLRANASWIS